MLPAIIVLSYLIVIAAVGGFAYTRSRTTGEDYFLASRSLGEIVFLLSLFGTNMTAFAILGSSGMSYKVGIGVYGLMASSSGLVIPLSLFFIGTRLWALGKRFGHMTQVDYFRDRWECSHIGTFIFGLTAAMLVPYIIIALMGGGFTLETLSTKLDPAGKPIMHMVADSGGKPVTHEVFRAGKLISEPVVESEHYVPYWAGALAVVLSVSIHIMLGGMRGAAWVNTFQTVLFLLFGALALILIGHKLGGFDQVIAQLAGKPPPNPPTTMPTVISRFATTMPAAFPVPGNVAHVTRARLDMREFFSYMFIPLSSIMFPHMAIMCLSAKRVTAFKKTVIAYPICIMLIWLPCVFLGVGAASQFGLWPGEESDNVLLRLVNSSTTPFIAAFLGAGIMSCVMSSDSHQILGLVTMFTRDIFVHYGGKERFGPRAQAWTGRIFVLIISALAYVLALKLKNQRSIFELAIQFAFSGFAAMAPVMIAALFWKRSTKWGALAASMFVAASILFIWYLTNSSQALVDVPLGAPPHGPVPIPSWSGIFIRTSSKVTVWGFMPVMFMTLISGLLVWAVSLVTPPPSHATIDKYFPPAAQPMTARPLIAQTR